MSHRDPNSLLGQVRVCLTREPTLSTNELFVLLRPRYQADNPRYLRNRLNHYRWKLTRQAMAVRNTKRVAPAPIKSDT